MELDPETPGLAEWRAINAGRVASGQPELPWPDFPAVLSTPEDRQRMDAAFAELAKYAPTPEPNGEGEDAFVEEPVPDDEV
jgi:hypothetical protein